MHVGFEITIAVCACIFQRSEPTLTVTPTSHSVTIVLGDFAPLTVQIEPADGVTGYWTQFDSSGNEVRIEFNGSKYVKTVLGELWIFDGAVSDTGLYVFHATNGAEFAQNEPIPLYVGGAPVVSTSMSIETVSLSSTFTLDCTYTSSSSSIEDVYWSKIDVNGYSSFINETNINKYSGSTLNKPSLTIMNIDNSDLGKYWCYAKSSTGEIGISSQITLSLPAGSAIGNFLTIPSTSVTYSTAPAELPVSSVNQANSVSTASSTSPTASTTSGQGQTTSATRVSQDQTTSTTGVIQGQTTSTTVISQGTAVSNISDVSTYTNSWTVPTTSVTFSTASSGMPVTSVNQAISFATTTSSTSQATSTTSVQGRIATTTTTSASQGDLLCPCDCEFKARIDYWAALNLINYTLEELRIILQPELTKLEEKLRVNKANLSSTIRKLTCAKDNRPVAKGIGAVGIVFIICLIACILIADMTSLKQHISNIKKIWNIKKAEKTN